MGTILERHPAFNTEVLEYLLISRNWEVNRVPVTPKDLTPTPSNSDINCMDDRDTPTPHLGPKIPGGGYLIMGEYTGGNECGLAAARRLVEQSGFKFGVHGDDEEKELGCGFGKLWMRGQLPLSCSLQVNPAEIVANINLRKLDAVYREFRGDHRAEVTEFNPFANHTRVKNGTTLYVDAWYLLNLGMSIDRIAFITASAVEGLKLPRRARILVPR